MFISELEAGDYIKPGKMLFRDFVKEWIKNYANNDLSASTYDNYISILHNRILPVLGHRHLDTIKPLHILTLIEEMKNSSPALKNSTINYTIRVIKNIFKRAIEWQMLKSNPAEKIKKLPNNYEVKTPYSLEETKEIMTLLEVNEDKWSLLFQLDIFTALRRGELLGLEWCDIDFKKCKITIRQSVTYARGQFNIVPPKTAKSKRTMSIPKNLVAKLARYRLKWLKDRMQCGELWQGEQYSFVFSSWNGRVLYPTTVTHNWKKFTKRML